MLPSVETRGTAVSWSAPSEHLDVLSFYSSWQWWGPLGWLYTAVYYRTSTMFKKRQLSATGRGSYIMLISGGSSLQWEWTRWHGVTHSHLHCSFSAFIALKQAAAAGSAEDNRGEVQLKARQKTEKMLTRYCWCCRPPPTHTLPL